MKQSFQNILKAAKKHPWITVSIIGLVVLLAVMYNRQKSNSSGSNGTSQTDNPFSGISGGGSAGGGSFGSGTTQTGAPGVPGTPIITPAPVPPPSVIMVPGSGSSPFPSYNPSPTPYIPNIPSPVISGSFSQNSLEPQYMPTITNQQPAPVSKTLLDMVGLINSIPQYHDPVTGNNRFLSDTTQSTAIRSLPYQVQGGAFDNVKTDRVMVKTPTYTNSDGVHGVNIGNLQNTPTPLPYQGDTRGTQQKTDVSPMKTPVYTNSDGTHGVNLNSQGQEVVPQHTPTMITVEYKPPYILPYQQSYAPSQPKTYVQTVQTPTYYNNGVPGVNIGNQYGYTAPYQPTLTSYGSPKTGVAPYQTPVTYNNGVPGVAIGNPPTTVTTSQTTGKTYSTLYPQNYPY